VPLELLVVLLLVIATALVFDFTNGFHDTGNAATKPHSTNQRKIEVREVVTTPIARTCSGNARRPSRACSLRTEEDSRTHQLRVT